MSREKEIKKTQVIIVGAGPTGLSMAVQLLRYNIDFIIIEKNEKTTHLSKAIAIQARTLEIFQEAGLAEQAMREGKMTVAGNIFYKGKQRAKIELSRLGEGLSPFPFALSLEQSKTEKLLVDHLSTNGKTIRWNSVLTRFEQNENGVTALVTDSMGQEQEIEAAYLVGCDGAGSLVRHQMGSSYEGDTIPKLFYVADVLLKSPVINKNELFIFLIKKGFVLFFPMEGTGHYRLIGILSEVKDPDAHFEFSDIEDSIKQQVLSPLEFEELRWFSSYKVHSRKADSFANGRSFIAGDAAHIHTPAGGQGMNTGIQDAYNLAWKIAYTIRDEVNSTVLESYNSERMENARHLLKTTDRLFDLFAGTTGTWNFIRLKLFPVFAGFMNKSKRLQKRIFPLLSQTAISYSKSKLTIKSSLGRVKAGVRMPYFILPDGKQIFEYLTAPSFKILFFGKKEMNKSRELDMTDMTKLKIVSLSFTEIPRSLFGSHSNFYILLRPDNHISYIGKEIEVCRKFIETIT